MRKDKKGKMKFRILVLVLIMLLTGLFFASLLVGTYPIPVGTVWDVVRDN